MKNWKNSLTKKSDIKNQRLNKKIQKTTLNYGLAEQYAPIMNLQEKQIKRQEENTQAIEDQTKMLEETTSPSIKSPILEAIESDENEEENIETRAINADFSDMISTLLNQENTHPQMKFSKEDFNNYKINKKPFEIYDDKINFDRKEFEISSDFLKLFVKRKSVDFDEFTNEETNALSNFTDYAGGLERDKRSNLSKALRSFNQSNIQNIDGDGVSFIFLSSEPNVLVKRFDVLVGESLAGNTNAFREASALLHELLGMKEISEIEYENARKISID